MITITHEGADLDKVKLIRVGYGFLVKAGEPRLYLNMTEDHLRIELALKGRGTKVYVDSLSLSKPDAVELVKALQQLIDQ